MRHKNTVLNGKTTGNLLRLRRMALFFPVLLALHGLSASASSITNDTTADAGEVILIGDAFGPPGQEYHFFQSSDFASLFDDPFFANLGLAPGTFLFGPNTYYDFAGVQRIGVLSVIADPALGVIALHNPNTVLYEFTFTDSVSEARVKSATPEPEAASLLCTGLLLMWGWAALRFRRRRTQSAIK